MQDIDFATCDFIDKNMNYINYFDFCNSCYSIKAMYNQLTNLGKRFYKWYIYANIHMEECYKNAIWNFLNSDEIEYYMELIEKNKNTRSYSDFAFLLFYDKIIIENSKEK